MPNIPPGRRGGKKPVVRVRAPRYYCCPKGRTRVKKSKDTPEKITQKYARALALGAQGLGPRWKMPRGKEGAAHDH